jgi:hypothetical protein
MRRRNTFHEKGSAPVFAEITRSTEVSATAAFRASAKQQSSRTAPPVLYLRRNNQVTFAVEASAGNFSPESSISHCPSLSPQGSPGAESLDQTTLVASPSKVKLPRKRSRTARLAFYFLAIKSDEMTESQDAPFRRVSASRRELETFAVRSGGFEHTGRGFAGVCQVDKLGVATARLGRVEPNTVYMLAVCFSQDSPSTPPFVDALVLRETKDEQASNTNVVLRAYPHAPWATPLLRTEAAVNALAGYYCHFVSKATHARRPCLSAKVAIRGVGDSLCEFFIATIYKAIVALRAAEPSLHKTHRDPSAANLFTAMTTLAAPTPQYIHKGPWIVDWFDFCLLALAPERCFPRILQLSAQFRNAPAGAEGEKLELRLPYMALPDHRHIPAGAPLELYAVTPTCAADFDGDVARALADAASHSKAKKSVADVSGMIVQPDKHAPAFRSRAKSLAPAAFTREEFLRNAQTTKLADALPVPLTRLIPATGTTWTPARAIFAMCSVRQQLLLLRYYLLRGEESKPKNWRPRRYRVRRYTDDVDAPGYWDLDSDEEVITEEQLLNPPALNVKRTPFQTVAAWCSQRRVSHLVPSAQQSVALALDQHRRTRLNHWMRWAKWQRTKREFRKNLLVTLLEEHETSEQLRRMRDVAILRHYNRCWCFHALQGAVAKCEAANRTKHLHRRFKTWAKFAEPTPFRVKRPHIDLDDVAPSSLSSAVVKDALVVHCRLGNVSSCHYEAPLAQLSVLKRAEEKRILHEAAAVAEARRRKRLNREGEVMAATAAGSVTPATGSLSRVLGSGGSAPPTPQAFRGVLPIAFDASLSMVAARSTPLLMPLTPAAAHPSKAGILVPLKSMQTKAPEPVSNILRSTAINAAKEEMNRQRAAVLTLSRLRRSFPLAADMLEFNAFRKTCLDTGAAPVANVSLKVYDAERVRLLSPLVYALWAVNHHRARGECFVRWKAFAKTTILQRCQQEFVDRNMIPMQRRRNREALERGWKAWRAYRKSRR